MVYDYDLFVIGVGLGGLVFLKRVVFYGVKVAIVENDLVGGICVIRGCVLKKFMVYGLRFFYFYKDVVGYGWSEVEFSFDWYKLIDVVNIEVLCLNKLYISFFEKVGVEIIEEYVKFIDFYIIEVGDCKVIVDKILIVVGGKLEKIDIFGIEYSIIFCEIFYFKE